MDESEHPFSAYSREDTAEQPQSGAPPLVGGPDQPEPPPSGIPQQRLRNRHHRDGSLREERREITPPAQEAGEFAPEKSPWKLSGEGVSLG